MFHGNKWFLWYLTNSLILILITRREQQPTQHLPTSSAIGRPSYQSRFPLQYHEPCTSSSSTEPLIASFPPLPHKPPNTSTSLI